jgi:hypothetical protein
MAGDGGIDRIGDADQRTLNLLIRVSDGFEKGAVGRPFDTFFGVVALHPRVVLHLKAFKKKSVIASGGDNGFGDFRCWLG